MKVLIVDDSEDMRRMIKQFITRHVDEFVECDDGGEAFECYRLHHPDLVLMDIKMKGVDGLTATKEILAAYPQARVVIVSQWDTAGLRESARAAGAVDYVSKSNLLPLRRLIGS